LTLIGEVQDLNFISCTFLVAAEHVGHDTNMVTLMQELCTVTDKSTAYTAVAAC
jgi:hypothetical protein